MWQNGRAWGWTSMSSTGPTSKLDPKKLGYSYELRLVKDYGAGGHPVGFLGDGEAVYCADRLVPESIRVELESYLDWIADAPNKEGRAPETPSSDDFLPSLPGEEAEEDQEAVYYQWLPSVFRVYKDGHVEIASSINNVDPSDNLELHDIVANVFSIVLPLLSKCVSMSRFAKKYENPCLRLPIVRQWNNERQKQHTLDRSLYPDPNGEEEYKELQVIVKAANYILEPGQHYSGTWHVEGEPHEKIIASAIYYYASSAGIEDMGLAFRRRRSGYDYPCKEDYYRADITRLVSRDVLDRDDKTKLYQDVRESDSWRYETDGALQFGSVQTRENRVLVFPNSLQHRVRGISAHSRATGPLTRKILCFFLVDPDSPIATTADLPPRRWNSKRRTQLSILVSHAARTKGFELPDEVVRMVVGFAKDGLSWQEACAHRLELMHHRKYTKNEQNQAVEREFSLCEH
ncbi:hypothetical protein DFJ73DRAFT_824544 [Zopfochytrium polystomum]|nr:hypothetical protein DFJ73DRAFT_824544 [Zopfochytrium polystomum]